MRAIGYIRVSTEDQAEHGVSLLHQAERIRSYCKYRGVELIEIIEDAGVSGGTNRARDGFMRLLNRVESGEGDAVILYSLDRLSRDMLTLLALERLLNECNVELHTVEGAVDTSTPDGFMSFAMKAFLGEMERRQIKHRTKAALGHKKHRGEVVGSIPYGYQRVGDSLEESAVEQAIIRYANELHLKGHTLAAIERNFKETGIKTRARKSWTPQQIKRLIQNYSPTRQTPTTKLATATRQFIEAIA